MSSLIVISFGGNQFDGSLPTDMFLALPNLQIFFIFHNQISGTIPTSITNASNLLMFNIGANYFIGKVPSLGNHQHLSEIIFQINNLGGGLDDDLDFITSLKNCSKLEILSFSSNNFEGHLSNSIGNLSTQLHSLYVGDN